MHVFDKFVRQMKQSVAVLALVLTCLARFRQRHRLSLISLPLKHHSAWQRLLETKDDNGLIHITGFDWHTFELIHSAAQPHLFQYPNGKGGRPSRLDSRAAVALALQFLNSTVPPKVLCQVFASPPSTINRTLSRTLQVLSCVLPQVQEARITWPSPDEMLTMSRLVEEREPALKHVFGFVDGLWLQVQEPADRDLQNAYYNGWKGCCNISNILCWLPDGCICYVRFNCPGSWHDSNVASSFFDLLHSCATPDPYTVLADSGFPSTTKIRTPLREGNIISSDPVIAAMQLNDHMAITSIRQAAEWGMRVLQGGFGRLRLPLPWDAGARTRILLCCFYLSNLRTRVMGINQIRTVFDPNYVPNIFANKNTSTIDRYFVAV